VSLTSNPSHSFYPLSSFLFILSQRFERELEALRKEIAATASPVSASPPSLPYRLGASHTDILALDLHPPSPTSTDGDEGISSLSPTPTTSESGSDTNPLPESKKDS
jgi:hypothetical protein